MGFGGRDPFAHFDMMFSNMHEGTRKQQQRGPGGHMGGMMGSIFDNDDFFSSFNGMGGSGGGFSTFNSSMSFGRGGGVSSSTTMTTRVVNGKRVTVTEKTVQKAYGTMETTRSESTDGGGGMDMLGNA